MALTLEFYPTIGQTYQFMKLCHGHTLVHFNVLKGGKHIHMKSRCVFTCEFDLSHKVLYERCLAEFM